MYASTSVYIQRAELIRCNNEIDLISSMPFHLAKITLFSHFKMDSVEMWTFTVDICVHVRWRRKSINLLSNDYKPNKTANCKLTTLIPTHQSDYIRIAKLNRLNYRWSKMKSKTLRYRNDANINQPNAERKTKETGFSLDGGIRKGKWKRNVPSQ